MNVFLFCCPLGPPDRAGYEHQSIALAEGLLELGVKVFCNTNLWQQSCSENDFLVKAEIDPKAYKECDVVIFSSVLLGYHSFDLLPIDLFSRPRKFKLVFIDCADGWETPGLDRKIYQNVDLILKSHYCGYFKYPDNFLPWQFGLSNRIVNSTNPVDFASRNKTTLVNFRVNHGLRGYVKKEILPIIESKFELDCSTNAFDDGRKSSDLELLYWKQTGGRHYKLYYEKISSSMSCAVFGGELWCDLNDVSQYAMRRIFYKLSGKFPIYNYKIYQFDSWRLWESWAAGCCSFHVDFDRAGFCLPVQPINHKHYVGVDLLNLAGLKKLMKNSINYFEDIAKEGNEWALKHYSPKPVAERFLSITR